jgi:hypothetical protein
MLQNVDSWSFLQLTIGRASTVLTTVIVNTHSYVIISGSLEKSRPWRGVLDHESDKRLDIVALANKRIFDILYAIATTLD